MRKSTFILCSIFASTLFLFAGLSSRAQVAPVDTGASKVIIIENNEDNKPGHRIGTPSYYNLIRLNALELAKGVIGVGFERRISDVFSADIVLGYTMKDYIPSLFGEEKENDNWNVSWDYDECRSRGGLAFMFGTRIYPGGHDNFDGFYLAPHFYSRNYSYDCMVEFEKWNGSYSNPQYITNYSDAAIFVKGTDLGIRFGWQRETGINGFFRDFNIGFANRKTAYDQITSTGPSNGSGGTYPSEVTTVEEKTSVFVFLLGFNLGFAF
jgi:hypothetical protein